MRLPTGQRVFRPRALAVLGLLGGLLPVGAAPAPASSYPVVIGFERFFNGTATNLAEGGELLLGELGCANCHTANTSLAARLTIREGPRLAGLKDRVQPGYLTRWLENSHLVKPGTAMPDLLAASDAASRTRNAQAIVQFILSLAAEPAPANGTVGDADHGRKLFHSVGCVACHAPEPDFKPPRAAESTEAAELTVPSVPLGDLAGKYTPGGLARFLADPLRVRPSARMPHFPLYDQEARDIASYLTRRGGTALEASRPDVKATGAPLTRPADTLSPSDGERPGVRGAAKTLRSPPLNREKTTANVNAGRQRFAELGCAACHRVEHNGSLILSTLKVKSLAELAGATDRGCLAATPPAGAPNYHLSQRQREALAAALKQLGNGRAWTTAQRAQRWMTALNCFACHTRDGRGGPEAGRKVFFETTGADLEDEGRLPPTLTGVGRKLTPPALETAITGQGAVRPYMMTHMPDFGAAHARSFAQWFTAIDLTDDIQSTPRSGQENLVGRNMWGRALMGTTGLSCITCHNLRGRKSLGIGAMDLANAPKRLRPEWFRDYLIDPAKFRPGTRMPAFWPEGKPLTKANGGNTARQIDSIWVYLNEIDQSRLPEGMEEKGNFELKPKDGPIVFRTFMEGAGMHAIAVGFPQGLHAAFDAKNVCWSQFWKGRFLDAESTWDDRFTPPAKPLGEAVFKLPGAFQFLVSPAGNAPAPSNVTNVSFGGYRLDKQGTPTFLYRFAGLQIEDRVGPDAAGKALIQTLHLKGGAQKVFYRFPDKPDQAADERERLAVLEPKGATFQVHIDKNGRELRLPVRFDAKNEATLVLRWTW